MQKKKIGDHNGYLEIIGEDHTEKRIHYTFLCHKCGKTFTGLSYYLEKYADGCPECQLKEKYEKKLDGLFDKKYGKLTPLEFCGKNGFDALYVKCRCDCGNLVDATVSELKRGKKVMCYDCSMKKFNDYREKFRKEDKVYNTALSKIQPGKKLMKTNTSGYTGVRWNEKLKKYCVTIGFQKKNYYLGSYHRIEEAAAVRKIAEDKIFGGFLTWYEEHKEEIRNGKILEYRQ